VTSSDVAIGAMGIGNPSIKTTEFSALGGAGEGKEILMSSGNEDENKTSGPKRKSLVTDNQPQRKGEKRRRRGVGFPKDKEEKNKGVIATKNKFKSLGRKEEKIMKGKPYTKVRWDRLKGRHGGRELKDRGKFLGEGLRKIEIRTDIL